MPKLDIKHLLMLEAISAAPSLSDAARRLNITSSALSHRIREAERRVSTSLVARGSRRAQLTDAGIRLLNVAIGILRTLDDAERTLEGDNTVLVTVVRLAASTLSGYEWLPKLLKTLQQDHPRIELEVVPDVSLDPVLALRERAIDLAIMPSHVRFATLGSVPLFPDEMVVLVPASHPKASQPFLDVSDLVDEVYITDGTTAEAGGEYDRLFEPAGVRPRRCCGQISRMR